MNPVDNMYYDNVWYVKVFKDKVKVESSLSETELS